MNDGKEPSVIKTKRLENASQKSASILHQNGRPSGLHNHHILEIGEQAIQKAVNAPTCELALRHLTIARACFQKMNLRITNCGVIWALKLKNPHL